MYWVSGNVVRVRILICATRQKPCRKRVYRGQNHRLIGMHAYSIFSSSLRIHYIQLYTYCAGAQPRLKSGGDQVLGPNTGAGVGCGRESSPPAVRIRGYHVRKIFENSDAKSCILVTTCCETSCFLKTTAKKLGDQYIVGPQPKSWGPVSPGPYGCCTYDSSAGNEWDPGAKE